MSNNFRVNKRLSFKRTTTPTDPAAGDLYLDEDGILYAYLDGEWVPWGGGADPSLSITIDSGDSETLVSLPITTSKACVIDYFLTRNGEVETGTIYVAATTTGNKTSVTKTFTSTGDVGFNVSAGIAGGSLVVTGSSESGLTGSMDVSYYVRSWE